MTPPPATAAVTAPVVRPRRPRVGGQPSPRRPIQPSRPSRRARRVSGPARRSEWAGLNRPARIAQRLPGRLLDRLIWNPPARAWIGFVAFALIGIVAMQLWVVKLGVGIGRAIEHTELLQRENSALAIEDSALSSGERIEQLALAKGMVPAASGALHFDTLRGPLDARLAAAALARPIQAQVTSSSASAETGAGATAAGTEASAAATTTAGTEASATTGTEASAATGTEANTSPAATEASANAGVATTDTSAAAGTEASAGSAADGEASTADAPAAQAPAVETPATATPPASATAPAGSTEVASPPASSGGGTQPPPGG